MPRGNVTDRERGGPLSRPILKYIYKKTVMVLSGSYFTITAEYLGPFAGSAIYLMLRTCRVCPRRP
jgi:hypothetical protein